MKRIIYVMCVLLFLLLCGCAKTDSSIMSDIEFLSSEKCAGRLYKTEGNEAAVDYIVEQLADAGLVSLFGDAMRVPFTAELPTEIETQFTLHSSNSSLSLLEGIDYIPPIWGTLSIEKQLLQVKNSDDMKSFQIVNGEEVLLEMQETNFRNGWKGYLPNSIPTVNLTEEGTKKVQGFVGEQVSYKCYAKQKLVEIDNVIAVIPGEDRSRAIVLGAHFDHVGQIGEITYSGAVDNASGVSVLLQVARLLATTKPKIDIVFTFWNAEEHGLVGSKAGAELLKESYDELCYINVDCVGYVDGGNVEVITENDSSILQEELVELLHKQGYTNIVATDMVMTSDHRNFSFCGSVGLSQGEEIGKVIHRPTDKPGQLNYAELDSLAEAIASVLSQSANSLVEAKGGNSIQQPKGDIQWPDGDYLNMTSAEQYQYENKIAGQLEYDEYVLLPKGVSKLQVRRNTLLTLEEAQTYYPGFSVPENVGDFSLAGIRIYDYGKGTAKDTTDFTVLNWTPSKDTILRVFLYYVSGEQMIEYLYTYDIVSAQASISAHDSEEQMKETEWLYHSNEELGYYYVINNENTNIQIIRVGEARTEENGNFYCVLNDNHDREAFLDIIASFLNDSFSVKFTE